MKTCYYRGRRSPNGGGANVTISYGVDGEQVPLNPRLDLRNHSPDGFQWGYTGSGPAQLALAILADALADGEKALDAYQVFKFAKIALITSDEFVITDEEVRAWYEAWREMRGSQT